MSRRERKIEAALSKRKRMRLVKNDTNHIAERIRYIEDGYFILQDVVSGDYEVHSTENIGDTYCFAVPYDSLDARTLEYCRYTSTGRNAVATIEKKNERIQRSAERSNRNDIHDRSMELAERMSAAIQKDELHDGYTRTFSMS